MIRKILVAVATSLFASLAAAQSNTYVPSHVLPKGREIVLVYFGAESCGPCHAPVVKDAVAQMKTLVSAQARTSGAAFAAIGVANDWDLRDAANFIATAGPFDQLILGGNFANLAVERYVWRDSLTQPAMPQVLIVERTVNSDGSRITFSEPRVLQRVVGSEEIPAWVAKGAPIKP